MYVKKLITYKIRFLIIYIKIYLLIYKKKFLQKEDLKKNYLLIYISTIEFKQWPKSLCRGRSLHQTSGKDQDAKEANQTKPN